MRYWAYRTNKGRIIYDRPKHNFSWRDIHRIIGNLVGANLEFDLYTEKIVEILEKELKGVFLSEDTIDQIFENFNLINRNLTNIYAKISGVSINSDKNTTLIKIEEKLDEAEEALVDLSYGNFAKAIDYIENTLREIALKLN